MRRPACLFAVLALAAALPATAAAQSLLGSPQIGTPTQTTPVPTTPKLKTSSGGGGLTTAETIGLLAFGIGLIAVIAVIILTDARRKAPTPQEQFGGETASLHRHRQTKQRRRAKGREAKAQRKKNRPRN